DGRSYLDAIASLWYCNVGHGRRELADAAAAQMTEIAAYQTFEFYTNPPAEALAARIAELAPMPNARVFFTAGRRRRARHPGRATREIIPGRNAYPGMNGWGPSPAGTPALTEV